MSEAISIYMPKTLTQEIDLMVGTSKRYMSRAEFIRIAVYRLLEFEYSRQKEGT